MILSVPGDSGIKGRTASITEQLSQVRQYSVCLSDEAFVIETFNATYHANCFVIRVYEKFASCSSAQMFNLGTGTQHTCKGFAVALLHLFVKIYFPCYNRYI